MCGKTKDLVQCAEIHLRNGFINPDIHFGCSNVSNVDFSLVEEFISTLISTGAILYDSEIIELLNKEVLRKNMLFALEGGGPALLTAGLNHHCPAQKRLKHVNSLAAYRTKDVFEA